MSHDSHNDPSIIIVLTKRRLASHYFLKREVIGRLDKVDRETYEGRHGERIYIRLERHCSLRPLQKFWGFPSECAGSGGSGGIPECLVAEHSA
jgi:hypothetical protein